MEYEIYFQAEPRGAIRLEPEGLYYRLSGRCTEPGPGIWRLWACFGEESRLVGVCSPGDEGLQIEKRVSRQSWPLLPEAFVLGREAEGFRPWRGALEGRGLPDAMLRQEADGSRTLAIFAPSAGPVPLAEYVGLMQESNLEGRDCLLLSLPEGLPELPELPEEPEPTALTEQWEPSGGTEGCEVWPAADAEENSQSGTI